MLPALATWAARFRQSGRLRAGRSLAVVRIYSVDGRATAIAGLASDEMPIAWVDDDRALTLTTTDFRVIDRLDPVSGKRERWLTLRPPDPLLLRTRPSIVFTQDGRTYAANYQQIRTRLFLIEGLR